MFKSSDDVPVVAMSAGRDYTVMVYSSPLLVEDDYTVYKVDEITGESLNGIYANITDYSGRQQLAYSDASSVRGGFGSGRPPLDQMPRDGAGRPGEETGQPPENPPATYGLLLPQTAGRTLFFHLTLTKTFL